MKKLLSSFREFINEIFDLETDRAAFNIIVEDISRNVVFRGTNLWILIFAIMVASVGLNVNSTAVVIGAMLISPLMGPIIGIGLGVGIYDFNLIKKSAFNLSIAVFISVLTSALYFWISPLKDAQSELLGRTLPTIWDVVIAFFGGLAGIVAFTRKEKSNVIPGVAIATALMPPLCTAGYGIATGNILYFFGAFYLFFINSVFIAIATILIVRYLKIPYKEWVDEAQQKKTRYSVIIVSLITLIPSIYLAIKIVERSIYNKNVNSFINTELISNNVLVIDKKINPNDKRIELFVFGDKIDSAGVKELKNKLNSYRLSGSELKINQNNPNFEKFNIESMKTGIIEEIYHKNEETLQSKVEKIEQLEKELSLFKKLNSLSENVSKEITVQYPEINSSTLNKSIIYNNNSATDTTVLVILKVSKKIKS